MKYIKLKSRCRIYQCRRNHFARIIGPSLEFHFAREIFTHDDLHLESPHVAIINQPGLYEVRNVNDNGDNEVSYVVFDGKHKGEISYQDAVSFATHLTEADLKQIALKALISDRQKRKANRLRKKELCVWMLDAAQHMGNLEHRRIIDDWVGIEVRLPINVIPMRKPSYVGFSNPTLCGRNSTSGAYKGSPDFQLLISKRLNKLTRSELEKISKPMCKAYDEKAMIQRLLAVVNHAQPETLPNLQQAVDLTEHFNPRDCPYNITTEHYIRFLHLAADQGCRLHTNQITRIL